MSKIERFNPPIDIKADEQSLRELLEEYIKKSEELEQREAKVVRQVELMQSAVASLQAWTQSRKPSKSTSDSVHVDVKQIEEETEKIREETKRIQKEVREKIEENKKLQDALDRKKKQETGITDEFISDSFVQNYKEEANQKKAERDELEFWALQPSAPSEFDEDPGIQFFNEKLNRLQEMEKQLMRESSEEAKKAKVREKNLKEKLEMLEWESEIDRQLIQTLKKKYEKK